MDRRQRSRRGLTAVDPIADSADVAPGTAPGTIVFVTQLVDPDDPVLGFVVAQIEALATRCERLVVIANEVRVDHDALPCRVISLGKEHGAHRLLRGLRYERALLQSTRGP